MRQIRTEHFSPYIFRDAFDPLSMDYVKDRLSKISTINTDLKPSAYLYNLMLWSEVHGGKWLSFPSQDQGPACSLISDSCLFLGFIFNLQEKIPDRVLLYFYDRFFRNDFYSCSASCLSGHVWLCIRNDGRYLSSIHDRPLAGHCSDKTSARSSADTSLSGVRDNWTCGLYRLFFSARDRSFSYLSFYQGPLQAVCSVLQMPPHLIRKLRENCTEWTWQVLFLAR